jgi:hypothetical protein
MWRFYRRQRICRGVSLNWSRSGPSLSLGRRGAHVTFGRRGSRASLGFPGTGVSWYSVHPSLLALLIIGVIVVLAIIGGCH